MAQTNNLTLSVPDGTSMQVFIASPEGTGPFPGLILFQEAFGVNAHIKDVAERFAKEGYVVIAPELFHRTAPPGFEGPYGDFASIAPHFQGITEAGLEADITACWGWLQSQANLHKSKIACTGYCLGGRVSFIANSILPFKAAVCYYGGRIVPDLLKRVPSLHAPMLFCWGGLDKHIPQEHVDAITTELKKENKPYANIVFSYADHAFFCDARPSYNPEAAAEAWALTLAFLKNKLNAKPTATS